MAFSELINNSTPRYLQPRRERAILITIDYEGFGFIEDGEIFRGRALVINAPLGFAYGDQNNQVLQIDRQISQEVARHAVDPEHVKRSEFAYMESELLQKSRGLPPSGPESTLIPTHEYRAMERKIKELHTSVHREKAENLRLAEHNMVVRNQALRWKSLAEKLRLQRDSAPVARARRMLQRSLTFVKRVL